MNPIALYLADGTIFFVGMCLVAIASPAIWFAPDRHRIARSAGRSICIVGIILVLASSTPFAAWIYACWMALVTIVTMTSRKHKVLARLGVWINPAPIVAVVFSIILMGVEFRARMLPRIVLPESHNVYVIGDSISAGLEDHEVTWPDLLERETKLHVVNLARAGAGVSDALAQAKRVSTRDSLVFVEIGGNDILSGVRSEPFARQLDQLLASLELQHAHIVMFELPLPPLGNAFANAQRSLARAHHAILIPKWVLASIFRLQGATTDGLHLSRDGAEALAVRVGAMLTFGNVT